MQLFPKKKRTKNIEVKMTVKKNEAATFIQRILVLELFLSDQLTRNILTNDKCQTTMYLNQTTRDLDKKVILELVDGLIHDGQWTFGKMFSVVTEKRINTVTVLYYVYFICNNLTHG